MSTAPSMDVHVFRAAIAKHLHRAVQLMPAAMPKNVFDPVIRPMLDELDAIDTLICELDAETRALQDAEARRERMVNAKRNNRSLEDRVMRIDHVVQRTIESLGAGIDGLLLPMQADLCARAFIDFLDTLPVSAFAENRVIPSGFPASLDADVAAIIALMHKRKAAAAGAG